MSVISDAMRQIFIDTYALMELEKNYNYLNYGKYPYKDRKNSVQIIADFNVNAYSVNGLFTEESEYTKVYPAEVIQKIQPIITNMNYVTDILYTSDSSSGSSSDSSDSLVLVSTANTYSPVIRLNDFVEIEATTIQSIRYLFPFDCIPNNLGQLVLSL